MGCWVQIGANEHGDGCGVRECRKLFNEVMTPNLLEQKEFLRSVGKAHKPLGSYDLARIEPAEKGLKGLPLHRHRKSPRHAAIAGVQ